MKRVWTGVPEAGQRIAHVRGFDEGIAGAGYALADARGVLQAGSDLAHGVKPITPSQRRHMI